MMRRLTDAALLAAGILLVSGCSTIPTQSNSNAVKAEAVETSDIDRFWSAYDRFKTTHDRTEQVRLVQTEYLDRASPGLTAFAASKGCTAEKYADLMAKYPRFWNSARPNILNAKQLPLTIAPEILKFQKLYPEMKSANVYFLVGCMSSSGTASGDKVLIGTELALGDSKIDITELSPGMRRFLTAYYASEPAKGLNLLAVHEYVHTQQIVPGSSLLAQSVYEGAADFVAEKVTGKLPPLDYINFGPANDAAIKARFKQEMNAPDASGWLYSPAENSPFKVRDLGYYVGYAINKSYYDRTPNKRVALKQIIELNNADMATVNEFVAASGYFSN